MRISRNFSVLRETGHQWSLRWLCIKDCRLPMADITKEKRCLMLTLSKGKLNHQSKHVVSKIFLEKMCSWPKTRETYYHLLSATSPKAVLWYKNVTETLTKVIYISVMAAIMQNSNLIFQSNICRLQDEILVNKTIQNHILHLTKACLRKKRAQVLACLCIIFLLFEFFILSWL